MSDTTKTIQNLLSQVHEGRVVLPDFQRSFVWDPDDIKELIVSLLDNYYIGTFLMMEMPQDSPPFALRLVEGVSDKNPSVSMSSYPTVLLDGQQRISSMYYAFYAPNRPLGSRKGFHRFFINIPKLIQNDYSGAVTAAITTQKKKFKELSESPHEIAVDKLSDMNALTKELSEGEHKDRAWDINGILNRIWTQTYHSIELDRETPLRRVVETFERINRTGRPLSTLDLLVARLYLNKVDLRALIQEAKTHPFSQEADPDFALRVLALARGLDYRKETLLELDPSNFEQDWRIACRALDAALQRIQTTYGAVLYRRMVPARSLLFALAAMLMHLRKEGRESPANQKKVDEWYWATVFAERYDSGVNTTVPSDINAMIRWFGNDEEVPNFLQTFESSEIDFEVSSPSSSVYRGVLCLISIAGAIDFKTGAKPDFVKDKVQDDHIFPQATFKDDRVLNRTLLSSNQSKGGKLPSVYFAGVQGVNDTETLQELIDSHLISSKAFNYLIQDDLAAFLEQRKHSIVEQIEQLVPHGK